MRDRTETAAALIYAHGAVPDFVGGCPAMDSLPPDEPWQPIETAPYAVFVRVRTECEMGTAIRYALGWQWANGVAVDPEPDGWQPLPVE